MGKKISDMSVDMGLSGAFGVVVGKELSSFVGWKMLRTVMR
jgi:hypothetical protein